MMKYFLLYIKQTLRFVLKPMSFVPAIIMMCLIFNFSDQTADTSSALSYKVGVEVADALGSYEYVVKKIEVYDNCEVSIFIKKLRVDLGQITNLTKKLSDLNDMYKNVKKYKGVLDMRKVNNEGKYIFKKDKKSKNH